MFINEMVSTSKSVKTLLNKRKEVIQKLRETKGLWLPCFKVNSVTPIYFKRDTEDGKFNLFYAFDHYVEVDIDELRRVVGKHLYEFIENLQDDVNTILIFTMVVARIEATVEAVELNFPYQANYVIKKMYDHTVRLVEEELAGAFSLLFYKGLNTDLKPSTEVLGFSNEEGFPIKTFIKSYNPEEPLLLKEEPNVPLEKFFTAMNTYPSMSSVH